MKYTSKNGKVKIECSTSNSRLMEYMRDDLMTDLHKEWHDFIEEVAVAIRKSQPGDRLHLESKPIVVEIEHDPETVLFPEGQ